MKYAVILIPGLGDDVTKLQWATHNWKVKYDLEPFVHRMPWMGKSENFEIKLKRLLNKIDELNDKGYAISLLGTSAGGSCVINAYCARRNKISTIINVCGRLKEGNHVFPSLGVAARKSPSFKQSVLLCEKNLTTLSLQDRAKILTIRSLFDEAVPLPLIPIEGATNIRILSVGHVISMALAMTLYSKKITDFLLR